MPINYYSFSYYPLSLNLFRPTLEMSCYDYGKRRLATLYALCFMLKGTSHIGIVPQDISCDYKTVSVSHTSPYKVWRIC